MQGAEGCCAIGNEMILWHKVYLFAPPLSARWQIYIYMTSANVLVITHGTKQSGLGIQACSLLVSWHLCVYRSHPFYFAPNSNKIKQDPVFS